MTRRKQLAVSDACAVGAIAPQAPQTHPHEAPTHEDAVIHAAMAILQARMKSVGCAAATPDAVRGFLCLKLAALEREVFGVLFLNAQNRLIAFETMFEGTLTQTAVYPREVARAALRHNAASVILAHNHPSGCMEPSKADILLTRSLQQALSLVDVKVLDHFVVGHTNAYSFAEHKLLH